jgi:asparagine synthase (glutamine-hydrolysing)
MKRKCCSPDFQQAQILQDRKLQGLCLIHGEIHNYYDLKKALLSEDRTCSGDLHLALQLYRRHGRHFARKLNGLFCLGIMDDRESSFILVNDRFGMAHQVYWSVSGGRFHFATHLKTLLMYPGMRPEIDLEGLNLFLKYSYIPSPRTIFRGIRKLPPGHLLVFKDGSVSVEYYWEFDRHRHTVMSLQEAVSSYRHLLKESISRRLDSGGDVGILLSGGLDSSANVALAAECAQERLKTFSVGFSEPTFDERPYARIVARHFNTQHFEYAVTGEEIEDLPRLIWHLEEPYFEFGLFLTYLGMAAARKEVDIVIGGEGADQLFGTGGFAGALPAALRYLLQRYHLLGIGRDLAKLLRGSYFYDRDNLAFKLRLLWNRVTDLNDWYFYGYDENELRLLYKDPALAAVPKIFEDSSTHRPASFADLYRHTQIDQDLRHYVNENVMVKSGRMGDMLDLTLRESYLDVEVTDFLVSLDFPLKRSGTLFDHLRGRFKTKFLHRKAMEGILPAEIMTKPKQGGFVPVMIFLKDPELRKRIYHHLLNSEVIRQYFRTDYLNAIFARYENLPGKEIYWHNFYNSKANRILFLLTFDIWYSFYINNSALDMEPLPLSQYLTPQPA